jgi:hypothetical protein
LATPQGPFNTIQVNEPFLHRRKYQHSLLFIHAARQRFFPWRVPQMDKGYATTTKVVLTSTSHFGTKFSLEMATPTL